MKTKILIGAGAALLLLLNVVAFSSFGREPEPMLDARLAHCYQAFAGCNYMPGYNGYCTERQTATKCTRDYVYCTQCIPEGGILPFTGDSFEYDPGFTAQPALEGTEVFRRP